MCDIGSDDYDAPSVWDLRWQRARKPKPCASCSQAIGRGDMQLRHCCIADGSISVAIVCALCGEAHQRFAAEHDWSWGPESLDESLYACIAADEEDAEPWAADLAALVARRGAASKAASA